MNWLEALKVYSFPVPKRMLPHVIEKMREIDDACEWCVIQMPSGFIVRSSPDSRIHMAIDYGMFWCEARFEKQTQEFTPEKIQEFMLLSEDVEEFPLLSEAIDWLKSKYISAISDG